MKSSRSTVTALVFAAAAASSANAGVGVTIPGANLSIFDDLQRTPTHSITDAIGPIATSFANRSGSVASSADYGQLTTGGTQKLFSITDTKSVPSSSTLSSWFDTVTFTGAGPTNALFRFGVDIAAGANQTGYSSASGSSIARWTIKIGVKGNPLSSLGFYSGTYTVADGPTSSPKSSYAISVSGSTGSALLSPVGAGTTFPASTDFVFGNVFVPGTTYTLSATVSCRASATTYRITDALTSTCSSGLTWKGLSTVYGATTGLSDFAFQGASGFDYTQPYGFSSKEPGATGYGVAGQPAAAVPEPASWAMMIAGFGLVGAMARRRGAATFAA